jgi:hypothetical protein
MTVDDSNKWWGPNLCALYQRVQPLQSGKCSLDTSLTGIIDPPSHLDQWQWLTTGRELACPLFSPFHSVVIPHPRSPFIDQRFIKIAGFNLTIVQFDILELRALRLLDLGHVDLHITLGL